MEGQGSLCLRCAHGCVHAAGPCGRSALSEMYDVLISSDRHATLPLERNTRACCVSPPSHPMSPLSSEFIAMPLRCQTACRPLPRAALFSWKALGEPHPWSGCFLGLQVHEPICGDATRPRWVLHDTAQVWAAFGAPRCPQNVYVYSLGWGRVRPSRPAGPGFGTVLLHPCL